MLFAMSVVCATNMVVKKYMGEDPDNSLTNEFEGRHKELTRVEERFLAVGEDLGDGATDGLIDGLKGFLSSSSADLKGAQKKDIDGASERPGEGLGLGHLKGKKLGARDDGKEGNGNLADVGLVGKEDRMVGDFAIADEASSLTGKLLADHALGDILSLPATILSLSSTFNLRFPSRPSFPKCPSFSRSPPEPLLSTAPRAAVTPSSPSPTTFHGPCYVIGDNIDTDQIIPAEHLTLVPSKPDEYQKLGSLALCGLPSSAYPVPFVLSGAASTPFPIVIAGANFGCGSSREHAPVALGAAGVRAVVAEYYARIFFWNSISTDEMFPLESEETVIWKECTTGDIVTVDLDERWLTNHTTGKEYRLKPIGDAGPVIEAGGIFAYARKTGMIASASTA
ncbi:3-isopropylmalate dehydratase small subunit 1-like [Elaeis guineensis]|uniref:3-isopropylmalate dehydratase small subunit 1-like n=1 Tax=Elaeis guineensis var. tenera TaxID=51953 RepID=UPI003C6CE9FA